MTNKQHGTSLSNTLTCHNCGYLVNIMSTVTYPIFHCIKYEEIPHNYYSIYVRTSKCYRDTKEDIFTVNRDPRTLLELEDKIAVALETPVTNRKLIKIGMVLK